MDAGKISRTRRKKCSAANSGARRTTRRRCNMAEPELPHSHVGDLSAEAKRVELRRRRHAGRPDHAEANVARRGDRRSLRLRRNPADGLAEFHHPERAGRFRRDSQKGAAQNRFRHAAIECCAADSSPARAIPIANSRSRTRRATRWNSPIISRNASSSTQPVNIHLTGCPNSCAQHYMGDIGLLGTKVRGDGRLPCFRRRRFWKKPGRGPADFYRRHGHRSETAAGKNVERLSASARGTARRFRNLRRGTI